MTQISEGTHFTIQLRIIKPKINNYTVINQLTNLSKHHFPPFTYIYKKEVSSQYNTELLS